MNTDKTLNKNSRKIKAGVMMSALLMVAVAFAPKQAHAGSEEAAALLVGAALLYAAHESRGETAVNVHYSGKHHAGRHYDRHYDYQRYRHHDRHRYCRHGRHDYRHHKYRQQGYYRDRHGYRHHDHHYAGGHGNKHRYKDGHKNGYKGKPGHGQWQVNTEMSHRF